MSLNSDIKEKIQIFEDLLNSSLSQQGNSSKSNELNEILSILCSYKPQISINFEKKCMFCHEKIDKKNRNSFSSLTNCTCSNKFHKYCLVERILKEAKATSCNIDLNKIMCYSCKTPISPKIFEEVLGEKYFNKIQQKMLKNNENKENNQNFCSKNFDKFLEKDKNMVKVPLESAQNHFLNQAMFDNMGLKRCSNCGVMIFKSGGSNHITCVCGAQFCYICGTSPGKDCHKLSIKEKIKDKLIPKKNKWKIC